MARTNGNGSSAKSKSPSAKKLSPERKIELRAYEIYLERNGAPGNPLEDWVRAEREILQKSRKPRQENRRRRSLIPADGLLSSSSAQGDSFSCVVFPVVSSPTPL